MSDEPGEIIIGSVKPRGPPPTYGKRHNHQSTPAPRDAGTTGFDTPPAGATVAKQKFSKTCIRRRLRFIADRTTW
ncbi:unnamed protein product [Nesidiocoris tenuis]|uniref:Uncharacterized protein n=1 Tax=Nesidiocoris tenuis TaxID=355587 RepID=A0A6H5HN24_9HEMI|nr:unnamed protein product [Nesidiocoris tenuis]